MLNQRGIWVSVGITACVALGGALMGCGGSDATGTSGAAQPDSSQVSTVDSTPRPQPTTQPAPDPEEVAVQAMIDAQTGAAEVVGEIEKQAHGAAQSVTSTTNQAVTEAQASVSLAAAEKMYAGICKTCHGPKGEGMPGLGSSLVDDEWKFGGTDEAIANIIRNGLMEKGLMMQGFGSYMNDEEVQALVAYVRQLGKK